MQSLNVSLQWEGAPEGEGRGRGHLNRKKTSSVPEDLDTIEEEESEESSTIHSASYRKLRLLSTGSDDSGISIGDADFEERDTDHDSEDETDSCEERVTGRHILHSQELEDILQEAAVCTYCLDGKLELWQDSRRRQGVRSALFGDAQMKIVMEREQTFLVVRKMDDFML